jgi:hypothetical protein
VIPDSYFWRLDYSETPSFRKSDATGFEFDVSMLGSLAKPILSLDSATPPEEKALVKEFSTAGNHTYTFDGSFPATIEVYALGAGGGGQGGHSFKKWWVGDYDFTGTGGAGGGGAAAYMKLSIDKPVAFNVTIGKGGSGGSGSYLEATMFNNDWYPGNAGSNGGNTSVAVGSATLTAEGGTRGGWSWSGAALNARDEAALKGGNGGRASAKPTGVSEWGAESGSNGSNGNMSNAVQSQGGKAAKIIEGSEKSFGGGLGSISGRTVEAGGGGHGGYNSQSGSAGGNGKVLIVITKLQD